MTTGLVGAFQFLTRVPIKTSSAVSQSRIMPWLPIAGAAIGAVVGGVAVGLGELVPVGVAAALAIIFGLLLTGAFHEDGLGDVADAFGGGTTREARFEILKDSRQGTYGVAAIASSILLRTVCVASIAAPSAVFAGLVAAHMVGRAAAVGAAAVVDPATSSGLGAKTAGSMRPLPTMMMLTVTAAAMITILGWWAGPVLAAGLLSAGSVSWLAIRKIGGLTGDVLGAIEQVAECLVLVVVAGFASRYSVWWA